MIWWPASLPGFAIGLLLLVWGVRRISPQTETLGAFRLVAQVPNPDDWIMVGAVPEVEGFVEGIKAELEANQRPAQQTA
jgi:hypothetical protein